MPPWPRSWSLFPPEREPPLLQDLTPRRLYREAERVQKRFEREVHHMHEQMRKQWNKWLWRRTREQIAVQVMAAGTAVSTASLFALAFVYIKYFHRIPNGEWVTPDMLGGTKWIRGVVTRVGDSDNFRLYHTPGFGWKWLRRVPGEQAELKDETIHIRIAGIDAPEFGQRFGGRERQPGALRSLVWLKKQVEGKSVYCQLLQRDQYSRIVAAVHLKPRFLPGFLFAGSSLSLMMLRAGRAIVYEQKGAVYGNRGLAEYKSAEKEAQAAKKGIWGNGTDIETPAEYKRRNRAMAAADASGELLSPTSSPSASVHVHTA